MLINPVDVAAQLGGNSINSGGNGTPRLVCEDSDTAKNGDSDSSGNGGGGGGGGDGFLRIQTRRHPASFTRKHSTRAEYVGPTCKLSACFTAGLFPGGRPESEKDDGYLGDDFLAVLSTRCGNPIERVLARKKWVIPLIG